jgi:hypothetical protein
MLLETCAVGMLKRSSLADDRQGELPIVLVLVVVLVLETVAS